MSKRSRPSREPAPRPRPTWPAKFRFALRGAKVAVLGENSFAVHISAAVGVVAWAWFQQVSFAEWMAIVIVITVVMTAELLNTAIEHLARAVTREENPHVRNALDIAAAGVLAASVGAVVVGVMVLVSHYLARQ